MLTAIALRSLTCAPSSGRVNPHSFPSLLRRPWDKLRRTQARPHPGPLPSDGRRRTFASLVVYLAGVSIEAGTKPFQPGQQFQKVAANPIGAIDASLLVARAV